MVGVGDNQRPEWWAGYSSSSGAPIWLPPWIDHAVGHNHPKTPAVKSPYTNPSNTDLNVDPHAFLYQIEFWRRARE